MSISVPTKGVWTEEVAFKWEDAFVSGNGSHGVMIYGEPTQETIIVNHCRLYLPQGNSYTVPDMADYLTEFRKQIKNRGYRKALEMYYEEAQIRGYEGLTFSDSSHPGMHVQIISNDSEYKNYRRTLNYETGEIQICSFSNKKERISKAFTSRVTNEIVYAISPGQYTIEISNYYNDKLKQKYTYSNNMIHMNGKYCHSDGGYDGFVYINHSTNVMIKKASVFEVTSDDMILLRMKVVPYENETKRMVLHQKHPEEKTYHTLLEEHTSVHRQLFNRVTLSLTNNDSRKQSITNIVKEAKLKQMMTPTLIEKMYDAGRYMYICSAGELTPNLQGIWTGTFEPAWSGDFTFDTNVQLSIASALSSHVEEGLLGYFRLLKELKPGFKENARKYYGANGILSSAHSSNSGRHVHWNPDWPLHIWTCGAGWLAHWYFEYYRFTDDRLFLEEEAIPFLEEVVAFYQDFLTEDDDGIYQFTPSYSAENGSADNATQDVAVAKEVLMNLIRAYDILGEKSEKPVQCHKMLEKMPSYAINDDGVLKEWIDPNKEENYNHRHFSHLYPIFQSREFNEITNPTMWKAARKAFDKRLEAWLLNEEGNTSSTHGRMHSALCATQFHMPELIEDIFWLLVKNDCFYSSLMMSHYNQQEVFNVDGNGAFPQVIHEMLADVSNGRLTLLGSIPKTMEKGEIKGFRLPDGMIMRTLYWNLSENILSVEIECTKAQQLELYFPLFTQTKENNLCISFEQNKMFRYQFNLIK
ncbi:glycoside hydrolase N-terminal domain-containing protein [Gracilibacillus marinus]|uniref:Glycoside hydrolase N-terminal domain-containing protein n=1 Tax=Gracilibacillus marinus TaxID=630535 RepID=A0ABV8VW78_9BACI